MKTSPATTTLRSDGHWPTARLADVCELNPRRPAINRSDAAPTTFVSMSAVDENGRGISGAIERPFRDVKKGYTYFAEGDVLFAKITPCMQNGKHAIAHDLIDGFGFGSTEFHVIRPGKGLLAEWVHGFLLQSRMLHEAEAHFTGAVGQQRVPTNYLANLNIPLPPLQEQKRIAVRLNEQLAIIERAKVAAEERFRAAKALAPAYVMREFGNGPSKQWPRRTLKALSLGNGQYGTSQKSHPIEDPGTVPVLGIGNIKGGAVVWDRLKFTSLSPEDAVKYRLQAGDLLFCRTNSADLVGETAVFDGLRGAAFASYLVRFRVSPDLADPRFISVYMNSAWGRHFIQQNLSRAIGQANVSASVVAEMEIPTPPVAVQRGIMERLAHATAAAGQLAQNIREELHSIDRMPGALLRTAFNGDA